MTKPKNKPTEKNQTNVWDAIIKLLDVINDQFKTGNIYGVIILLAFVLMFILAWRLPTENINSYILVGINFLSSEKFYFVPFLTVLIVSVSGNVIQYKVYTAEILRLTARRKELVHGLNEGALGQLTTHTSSDFDLERQG